MWCLPELSLSLLLCLCLLDGLLSLLQRFVLSEFFSISVLLDFFLGLSSDSLSLSEELEDESDEWESLLDFFTSLSEFKLAATSVESSIFSSKKGITLALAGSKTSDGGIKADNSFSSFKGTISDSLLSSTSSSSEFAVDLLSEKVGIKIFKM